MCRPKNPNANPRRVAAGQLNHSLRRAPTEADRQRMRAVALQHKPWLHSTGPRSVLGKMKSSQNARKRAEVEPTTNVLDDDDLDLLRAMEAMQQAFSALPTANPREE